MAIGRKEEERNPFERDYSKETEVHGATVEMPKYQSHKSVHALKIKSLSMVNGGVEISFEDELYAPIFLATKEGDRIADAQISYAQNATSSDEVDFGYLVVYEDGYRSWSPSKAFEEGYIPVSVPSASNERIYNNVMRHNYRVLSENEKAQMQAVKDRGLAFIQLLHEIGQTDAPPITEHTRQKSRYLSLAQTKIEEAVMWAVKEITG